MKCVDVSTWSSRLTGGEQGIGTNIGTNTSPEMSYAEIGAPVEWLVQVGSNRVNSIARLSVAVATAQGWSSQVVDLFGALGQLVQLRVVGQSVRVALQNPGDLATGETVSSIVAPTSWPSFAEPCGNACGCKS